MKTAIIVTPYSGAPEEMAEYQIYFKRCCIDSKSRGEAPLGFHLKELYPALWNDFIPEERREAMAAAREWGKRADIVVVYNDYGRSRGMIDDINYYNRNGMNIKCRQIGKNPL